jgi:hypothetical protein
MSPVAGSGSAQLAALSARLKVTGDRTLRLELLRGLKSGSTPLVKKVADAARSQLPHGGGLNEQVAGQKVKVQVRTGARTAGVRMTTTAPDTSMTDKGFVRHPTFGRRTGKGSWVTQQIPAAKGWWSQTLADSAPDVQPELLAAMERVALVIQGGL